MITIYNYSLMGQTEIVWATKVGRSLTHRARYMYHTDTCLVLVWMCSGCGYIWAFQQSSPAITVFARDMVNTPDL